ncbi:MULTISPECIES: YiiD C-terminal domain-containing protein [Cobetia]|nr:MULTISPECIES: YiiD C-terminal domain-containing protein [Cobetia]
MSRQGGEAFPPLALPCGSDGQLGRVMAPVTEDLEQFRDWLTCAIPLAGQLGLKSMCWSQPQQSEGRLDWQLMLAPNLNDKGTAFGGAMSLEATLCGWSWLTLWLRARGIQRDIVVSRASQQFLAPVSGEYRLSCAPLDEQALVGVSERLVAGRRARLTLVQQLWCQAEESALPTLCFEAQGDYVVLAPSA